MFEMTGTNCTLDAARNGPERQRQLFRNKKLADENLFLLLTAHANGRPPFTSGRSPGPRNRVTWLWLTVQHSCSRNKTLRTKLESITHAHHFWPIGDMFRSEERRVGKECRSKWETNKHK